uniref:SCP domain-containing protein n=1 Tax=Globodera rostochiensis TaxID=31243 RepID=A0A914HLB1_GLORO
MIYHQLLGIFMIFGLSAPQIFALLSSDEQNYCATFHNDLRRTVANGEQRNKTGTLPSANNMLEMSYNETTGEIAQSWVDQCQFSHSQASGLGENIYYTTREDLSNIENVSIPT